MGNPLKITLLTALPSFSSLLAQRGADVRCHLLHVLVGIDIGDFSLSRIQIERNQETWRAMNRADEDKRESTSQRKMLRRQKKRGTDRV